MFRDFYFANPSASYFLLASFLIIVLLGFSLSKRKKTLGQFAASDSLQTLLFLEKRTLIRYILLICVWFLATFALMKPEQTISKNLVGDLQKEIIDEKLVDNTDKKGVITKRRACDVIFLLDTSASMEVSDTRQNESRLAVAKEIIDEMIRQMDGQNVALYTFTSILTPVVPPTLDYFFTRLMLKDVHINYGDVAGTDLFEAIDSISKKHFGSSSEKQKILVLLTDGGDTAFERLSKKEKENQLQVMLGKIKQYEKQNVRIYCVGLGSKAGEVIPGIEFEGQPVLSCLDSDLLIQMSKQANGHYFFANDYSSLAISETLMKRVLAENSYIEKEEIARKKIQQTVVEKNPNMYEKKEFYQFPLAIALIALGFELIIPIWPVRTKAGL